MLPPTDHVPVIGGDPETFGCVYVIGMDSNPDISLVGSCDDVRTHARIANHFKRLQTESMAPITLKELFWVPDNKIAKRVVGAVILTLGSVRVRYDSDWLRISPDHAIRSVPAAAKVIGVPLLSNQQYRVILRGKDEIEEGRLKNFFRSLGFSMT
jgi:hypothetical protein